LRDDGVIFVSIDDNEQAYLKVLMDDIFGRENFIGEIIWETATDNNKSQISIEHEYILVYSYNKENLSPWEIESNKANIIQEKYEEFKKADSNIEIIQKKLKQWLAAMKKSNDIDLSGVAHYSYVDERGVYYPGNSNNTKPGNYQYDIFHPIVKKPCKKPSNGWRWPESTFWDADKIGDAKWGRDESTIPKIKKRLETATELFKSYYYEDNRISTANLIDIMAEKVFDNPKSLRLLKKIITFTTKDNDIILDFHAGSGTTAHAVLDLNKEDGGNRKFILAEQMDYIERITTERVKKVIERNGEGDFVYAELKTIDDFRDENTIGKLNQNMQYLPISEIDDESYGVSEAEKLLNKQFYGLC
jgi:adenine-specific DNA-methyltransferase